MIKNRRELFSLHWTCASFAGLTFLAGCASTAIYAPRPTGWIKDEVADSYVFGYPLVLMEAARDAAVGTDPGQAVAAAAEMDQQPAGREAGSG